MKKNRPNCVVAGNDIFNMKSLGKDISALSCQKIGKALRRTQIWRLVRVLYAEFIDATWTILIHSSSETPPEE